MPALNFIPLVVFEYLIDSHLVITWCRRHYRQLGLRLWSKQYQNCLKTLSKPKELAKIDQALHTSNQQQLCLMSQWCLVCSCSKVWAEFFNFHSIANHQRTFLTSWWISSLWFAATKGYPSIVLCFWLEEDTWFEETETKEET